MKKGFTLIELIVVTAVLGVLSSIAVPRAFGFVERARITADQATVRSLNSMTPLYRINTPPSDPFSDETKSGTALIEVLVDSGYLSSTVKPQSKEATFTWLFEAEKWYLLFPDSFYVIGSLTNDGLSISNGLLGAWNGSITYSGSSKDIVIPNSFNGATITNIGQNVFRNKGLIAIAFEEGSQIKQIHARAFYDNNLANINLPDSVEKIDLWSFRNNNLTEIKLPKNLKTIEQLAFDGNDLNKITIGSNVTAIGDNAFGKYTNNFKEAYEAGGPGTYTLKGNSWVKQ